VSAPLVAEATVTVLKVRQWRSAAVVLTHEVFPLKAGESGLMRRECFRVYVSRTPWGTDETTTATFAAHRRAQEAFKDPRKA
jgi:hypothetical protein